jgi:hypothetical protein
MDRLMELLGIAERNATAAKILMNHQVEGGASEGVVQLVMHVSITADVVLALLRELVIQRDGELPPEPERPKLTVVPADGPDAA